MERPRGVYIMSSEFLPRIYSPAEQSQIAQWVDIVAPPLTRETLRSHTDALRHTDVIFSGWGGPVLDSRFLSMTPRLKAFFYGAGGLGNIVTPEVWNRGIVVTTAYEANAVPVAEYCLAVILFSLKHGWTLARMTREQRSFPPVASVPGAYGSTVGLISMGKVARTLRKLLLPFDLKVLAYDPFLTREEAMALDVERVSMEQLFRQADVVSLHPPLLDETRGLVTGAHVALMKPGATLINTARGAIVRQEEMVEVIAGRPDLQVILDVTDPEPPPRESALYDLPNVVLTPHIAGSIEEECRRMGQAMVEELRRYMAGQPLKWAISREFAKGTSHEPRGAA